MRTTREASQGPDETRAYRTRPAPGKRTLVEARYGRAALPHRDRMEQAFGADFSSVTVELGAAAPLGEPGAQAAARGEAIAFASTEPSPALVAHELAHVMQHRGQPTGGAGRGPAGGRAEGEADAVAARVAGGGAAGPIVEAPGGGVQCFAPDAHEEATVHGLSGAFAPDEIAETYAANWERDFAQGHPAIAAAAIAWAALKQSALQPPRRPDPDAAARFKAAVWAVIDLPLTEALLGEAYGGSEELDHLDRPGGGGEDDADERWGDQAAGLAGYLCDARAYIQEEMLAAVNSYRISSGEGRLARGVDPWDGVERPAILRAGDAPTPRRWGPDSGPSRDPIRAAARTHANAAAGQVDEPGPAPHPRWRVVGQHLGRASHALEDFWAHSNWLELADRLAANPAAPIEPGALQTGRFETPSKVHALGHKLVALADEFHHHLPLLRATYGRAPDDTDLHRPAGGRWRNLGELDSERAYHRLDPTGCWLTDAIGVGIAADAVEELVQSERHDVADFLCNDEWLAALRAKGVAMIADGHDAADGEEHAALAKDQALDGPAHGRALALATAADRMAFAPLRLIMEIPDEAVATAAILGQLAIVEALMQPPSPQHPLWQLARRR